MDLSVWGVVRHQETAASTTVSHCKLDLELQLVLREASDTGYGLGDFPR